MPRTSKSPSVQFDAATCSTSIAQNNQTTLVFTTKLNDNMNAYNTSTGEFTCPVGCGGAYVFSAGFMSNAGVTATAVNNAALLVLQINGVDYWNGRIVSQTTSSIRVALDLTFPPVILNDGDKVRVQLLNVWGNTITLGSSGNDKFGGFRTGDA